MDNTSRVEINALVDLSVIKVDSPDPVTVGSNLTYRLIVTNNSPVLATGVTLTDTLPSGVTFVSAAASQGNCSGTSTVTCDLGDLQGTAPTNEASATVTIVVIPVAAGTITNTASVAGNEIDPNTTNNTATAVTTGTPAVGLQVSANGVGDLLIFPYWTTQTRDTLIAIGNAFSGQGTRFVHVRLRKGCDTKSCPYVL